MTMGHSEIRPGYDYHLVGSKLQESTGERDFEVATVSSLSPENQIWRVINKVTNILVNVKITIKYTDKKMCRKNIYNTYWTQIRACISSLVTSLKEAYRFARENPTAANKNWTSSKEVKLQGKDGSHRLTHLRREKDNRDLVTASKFLDGFEDEFFITRRSRTTRGQNNRKDVEKYFSSNKTAGEHKKPSDDFVKAMIS